MSTATVLSLGAWNFVSDSLVAHPASPTGAIYNLNDGATWSLLDPSGNEGTGLDLGNAPPDVLKSGNPRTTGERVTRINWGKNRVVRATLFLGPTIAYPQFVTALHNLQQLCAGITPDLPGALQFTLAPTNATTLVADVLQATVITPYKETIWIADQNDAVEVIFECKPHFRGSRQWLQNLVWNPGFETPSGPGVTTFSDPFTNTNAYSIQVGGPLGTDTTQYPDAVQADNPFAYFRLDEASGTTAFDVTDHFPGTTSGSPTQGVAGLLTGDSDTCYTFAAASSQKVTVTTLNWNAANLAFSVDLWMKFAANPAGSQFLFDYGNATRTNHQNFGVFLDSSGRLNLDVGGGSIIQSAAQTTGTAHHVAATWDGTNARLYIDGAQVGTGATPGNQAIPASSNFLIGCSTASANFFSGQLDEVATYGTTLSGTRVTAHYNTGHNSPVTNSASITMPANCQIKFGSPAWQAVNQWQVRFRYASSGSFSCYLHFTDSNNFLLFQYNTSALGTVGIFHKVAGVLNTLATTTSVHLTPGAKYWLTVTQFPSVTNNPPQAQVVLAPDAAGAPAVTAIATVGPITSSSSTVAIAGAPQLLAGGATIGVDKNTVSLFGPGGWYSVNSGTAQASGAWDGTRTETGMSGNSGNTYTGGPITSYGAARIDGPPAGSWTTSWRSGDVTSATTVTATALPVKTAGDVVGVSVYAMNNTSSVTAAMSINFTEYDSGGNLLRTGANVASLSGAQASYTQMSGTYTTGANCAYVILICAASDSTANSAGKQFWFDNAQCWDQTQTGMTTMPYCELRFPQSPAQLMVSGILGDVPAYAFLAAGTISANFTSNTSLTWYLGRRAQVGKNAILVGAGNLQTTGGAQSSSSNAYGLDTTALGGYTCNPTATIGPRNPRMTGTMHPTDIGGYYHFLMRYYIGSLVGSFITAPTLYAFQTQRTSVWYGDPTTNTTYQSDILAEWDTAAQSPPAYQSWFVLDFGQITIPGGAQTALADGSQTYIEVGPVITGSIGGGDLGLKQGWQALIPVDGNILIWTITNPSLYSPSLTSKWVWTYSDGLTYAVNGTPAWNLSTETAATPNPAHAGGGLSASFAYPYLQSAADPCLSLDPSLANDTNQIVAVVYDSSTTVLPFAADIIYGPRYLQPN